ncbi:hypothetical protein G9A89_016807 [Geosiphon pyriformis]|nr:hypothetical protein G9A89_016807 [Geosiphon pyriformis]
MTTIKAKSKKAVLDICPEIFNKISTKKVLSVVKATRQNVLEAFFLSSNRDKLPLVVTKATSSSLAGFSPVKVLSKRHTWVSLSVASTLTKSPKIFNNRPVTKLHFLFKKIVKKTKSSEKWKQSLASAIVTPNSFVVPNKISIVLSSILSKIGLDQSLAVLLNMVSSGRLLPVLEAKQSPPVESSVLGNWADQMETESSPLLVSGAAFGMSLKAAFLVKLTSSVYLVTLKIAKSLVISESGPSSAAVVLCDVPLGMFAADIKTAFSVFGSITYIVLKPAGIWQYVVVYFKKLDFAVFALNHWSVLVDKNSVKIFPLVNQNETILFCDKFKAKLVNFLSECTAFEISDMISQIGGQTCFISHSLKSGCYFRFALVTFGFQTDLDSAIVKTSTLRKCHIW